jgi:hypothetical protein
MFDQLSRIVEEALAGFDPAGVPTSSAEAVWLELDRVERLVAGAKLRLSARVEEGGGWRRAGRRSAADQLAVLGGMTVGQARGLLETSKRLAELPVVESAVAAGRLSAAQVHSVADAASAAPSAQSSLIGAAGRESVSELRDRCGRVKAAADRDAEATYRRLHAGRFVRTWSCPDGAAELRYRSTPDEVAEVVSVVRSFADRLFREAHRAGQAEPAEAYLADGLLAAVRGAAGAGQAVGRGSSRARIGAPDATIGSVVAGNEGGQVALAVDGGGRSGRGGAGDVGAGRDVAVELPVGSDEPSDGPPAAEGGLPTGGVKPPARSSDPPTGGSDLPTGGSDLPTGGSDPSAQGSGRPGRAPGRVVPKEVIVRVDWDALVRGWPVEGEVCEVPGIGPVPVSLVRAMVESGDAVLKAVVTRGTDVVNVAHLRRQPSAVQRTALRWLDLVCVEPGCVSGPSWRSTTPCRGRPTGSRCWPCWNRGAGTTIG